MSGDEDPDDTHSAVVADQVYFADLKGLKEPCVHGLLCFEGDVLDGIRPISAVIQRIYHG